ncbi:flagellin [Aliidiomarina sedimenti]|uniref:Flagellin n=1 Tax=Aliidiomarina sedimenti TaxID=1933879 RepID=A0ABY0BY53_9GAMM|nr:flagellin [Aliidiomarina sedimenti]RUO29349.1 flagellin [Aliidiomarina sedimenti]
MKINNPASGNSILQQTIQSQNQRMEQLASGNRVNRASDDAAALQIIERMNSEATAFQRSVRNAFDGISVLQVAEGGMQQVQNDLQRMRELSVQAGNGILSDNDRSAIGDEMAQLRDGIYRTLDTTNIGGTTLLNQDQSLNFLVGTGRSGNDERMTVDAVDLRGAGLNALETLDVSTASGAADAISEIDDMLSVVGGIRADYGAKQSAFVSAVNNLTEANVNIQAARSRIRDLDYAEATANQTRDNILGQSAIALRGQATLSQSQVLNLLD